jgi:hypothetical protein
MKIRLSCLSAHPWLEPLRRTTLRAFLTIAFFCAGVLAASAQSPKAITPDIQAGSATQLLRGHVPAVVPNLAPVGRLSASRHLNLAITLPLRNQDGLSVLLQQLYDPSSSMYRHYFSPEQFAEMFGPSAEDYQAVVQFAKANGLTVTATYPSRLTVDVNGSVADIEKALHVTLRTYHHPKERRDFFAPDAEPSLDLSVPVLHISGLDTYSLAHPASLHARPLDLGTPVGADMGSATNGAYIGSDFRNAYFPGVSLDGTGQIVGLLEFDAYFPADIDAYVTQAGQSSVTLENVYIDGFNGVPGSANGEVALDIEVVIAMAPGISKIRVYQAPVGSPFVDLVTRMASDTQVKQFSSSWAVGNSDRASDQVFQQMAAQGQSFFNASGDSDAFTGDVPFPSDSAYVTSVGGTTLTTSTNGAYTSEKVWNPGQGEGSGGGTSTFYPIPTWQQDVDMTVNGGSTTLRNIPDVALTADNIFIIADNGTPQIVGGTSAAAPLWAAVIALANEQATAGCGASVGFLNPTIYGIGKGSSYTNDMNDIIKGNNFSPGSPSKFSAVVGYDLCTGWGTPKPALLGTLAGPVSGALPLNIQPLSGSALISTDLQPVSVTISGVTNATVFATVSGSASPLNFTNTAGSVYTALLQVPAAPASLSMTVMATAPGRSGVTNTVNYTAVPAPLNDNFANATKVPAGGAAYVSNNRYATIEPGEPKHDGDANAAGSLWWAWTPATTSNVLIDTAGSRVDNVLAVYIGNALSTLQPVASTSSDVTLLQPGHVIFNAQAGQAYYIAFASANSNSLGSLRLAIQPGAPLDTIPPTVAISSPQSGITVSNQLVTVTGTAADLGPNASGVNKVLITVNGCAASRASGTTSWTATIPLQPELNVVQAMAYDEAGNVSAPATIELVYFAVNPVNDFFASATPLTGLLGTNSVDTSNATKEAGEPNHAGNAGGKSVWYSFTAPANGVLTLDTEGSTFDTLLAVYLGSTVSSLTPVGSDDDAYPGAPGGFSYLNQVVHSNLTYHIAIDGYGGASGIASLTYSFVPTNLVRLNTTVAGSGTVQLATINNLGGQSIQPSNSIDVAVDTKVVLTPTPSSGSQFEQWSGAVVSFVSPLMFTVTTNTLVVAQFIPIVFSDDFESGTLTHLNWATAGNAPWVIESTNVAAGNYAARSGVIGNSQSSSLILTTNFAAGSGSFDFRVSSELNFDFLQFFIDGNLIQQWSGEAGWANFKFPMPSGAHTLEWSYVKDPSGSAGLDAAFIDNVLLPIVLPINSSTPALLSWIQDPTGAVLLSVAGQTNQQYIVQTSTDLINWQDLFTGPAVNGVLRIDPGTRSSPAQFYRAVVPLP